MKKLFWGICFLTAAQIVVAQSKTIFQVSDVSGASIAGASIEIEKTGVFAANDQGVFTLNSRLKSTLHVKVTSVGYIPADTTVLLPANAINIVLKKSHLFLDPVEVKALRAGEKAPFAKTNIGKGAIEKQNLGQDLPFLLSQTPSVIVTSDAGNGVGYTGIRIRGTDATRINVTINGIPYNDAESQGTYFVDLPDISSSLNSIQIQRGVGTSSNGAGAFGGSINLSTNELNEKAYAEVNNSFGSFNTWKNTVKFGTGLLGKHFSFDGRISRISSDGFIDRGSTNLKSLFASAAYTTEKSSIRFNIITGTEKTYQAWNGIPQYKLFYNADSLTNHYYNNLGSLYFTSGDSANLFGSNPRKYNMFTYPNQTDNYQQDHYQLFFNHQFNQGWSLNSAIYLTRGRGYYEEYKNDAAYSSYGLQPVVAGTTTVSTTDLIRRLWLDNNLYGTIFSLLHKTQKDQFTIGGGWNEYDGKHYGNIEWAANGGIPYDYRWYYNKGVKKDFNVYTKYQYKITPHLEALVDLQYRRVDFDINGTRKFPDLQVNNQFNFFNPKLGLTYSTGGYNIYGSYAMANKEPNRDDYETGSQVNPPRREQLHDIELGVDKAGFDFSWSVNAYYMRYKDQLILTGRINDVGDPVRINTPDSYRAGIELQARYKLTPSLQLSGNLTLSDNQIKNYYDYTPRYDANFNLVQQDTAYYRKTPLAYSPSLTAAGMLQWFPFKNAELSTSLKYAGKQYMDNTGSDAKSIRSYLVEDLNFQYNLPTPFTKNLVLVARINNLWNRRYESNGYTYSYIYDNSLVRENFYFPMAGRNFVLAINMRF